MNLRRPSPAHAVLVAVLTFAACIGDASSHATITPTVYCEGGPRTEYAESVLKQAGFEPIYHLEGDMGAWRMSRLPVERQ